MSSRIDIRPQNILLGVSLIIAAALTISIQDVVFKLFSSELTLWQIFTLRGVFALPMLMAVWWLRGAHKGLIRASFGKWVLLRSIFITTTFLAFYSAIPFLSLSTVGAANYIAPIFVTILSAYVIREPVRPLGWVGVLFGFVGVIILLQPGTDASSPWGLLPILGAGFYALAHITTRVKCQNTPLPVISFSQNMVMLLAGIFISLFLIWLRPQGGIFAAYPYIFAPWSTVETADWLVLILLAGFAISIGMMLAGAYQAAPPSVVSTFEYSYLVFVAIWDILFFGSPPTPSSILGMGLIVFAGLLVLHQRKS